MDQPLSHAAEEVAVRAHADQRYGDNPYRVHLAAVVKVLRRFDVTDEAVLAAGWLHDALEDTELTPIGLARELGKYQTQQVAAAIAIVDACTDGNGANRKERKARVYRLIPRTKDAVIVKLADRIANVEACRESDRTEKLKMYRREQPVFLAQLGGHGGDIAAAMWAHLGLILAGA
ncbi:MAG: (p)ppGpp synthase/HD superfamily hydrolase [Planctomycetota bacterium]|jgi:(p)ppGpp synthase/HD superfamily hydrolase